MALRAFDGTESVAFDLDAEQIQGLAGFYGKPKPSQTVSTVALPNPWDLTPLPLTSASDGADFSFLFGRELNRIWNEIGTAGTSQTARALVTVVDEEGGVVESAAVVVSGEEFLTDDFGQATIVFAPGTEEAVVTAKGFESHTFSLEFATGEAQFSRVILYPSGPGLADKTTAFMEDHWPTLVLAISGMVALALLWLVIVTPSRYTSPRQGQTTESQRWVRTQPLP